MRIEKTIGMLLIAGAIGVFIPYTVLTVTFEYPDILRQDTGSILTKFYKGGSSLILTWWWAFAIFGVPLLIAYILIGQKFENRHSVIRSATTLGIISVVVQIIGLLRWVFVVPVLANHYVSTTDAAIKNAAIVSFQTIHQFGGVLLGEHLGQLFTIAWTVMISYTFIKIKLFSKMAELVGNSCFRYLFWRRWNYLQPSFQRFQLGLWQVLLVVHFGSYG
jgi:hypothetical protein